MASPHLSTLGLPELFVILLVVLVLFGGSRLHLLGHPLRLEASPTVRKNVLIGCAVLLVVAALWAFGVIHTQTVAY